MRALFHGSTACYLAIVLCSVTLPSTRASSCLQKIRPRRKNSTHLPRRTIGRNTIVTRPTNRSKLGTQYWGWVKSFHEGSFFVSGWTDRAKELVEGVKPGPDRKKLVKEINDFGRDICREWAKDSSVCKVGTADLTRWGKAVETAKKADRGDGEELAKAMASIREEYKKKLNPPPEQVPAE